MSKGRMDFFASLDFISPDVENKAMYSVSTAIQKGWPAFF